MTPLSGGGGNGGAGRLAVLIDADNAQPAIIEGLLAEIAKYGTAHVKRAYGDWTGASLRCWKEHLLSWSIQPVQQFAYTVGKNATDAALIIDAMDLLYIGRFDGFCLLSNDSDFTRLAARIREAGLSVYGFGERKTPEPFVKACDRFTYTENLSYPPDPVAAPDAAATLVRAVSTGVQLRGDTALVNVLRNAIEAACDEDGWPRWLTSGTSSPSSARTSTPAPGGYTKLSELVAATTLFQIDRRVPAHGKPTTVYVRDKRRKNPRTTPTTARQPIG